MQRTGFTIWEFIGVVALLFIGAAICWPSRPTGGSSKTTSCQNNLRSLGISLAQYSADNGQKLPPVVVSQGTPYGWADGIYIYVKNRQVYQCPVEATDGADAMPTERGHTDYWFNAQLSAFNTLAMKSPADVLLIGDGNDGSDLTDARYNLFALPAAWLDDKKSPVYRHFGRAAYLFADGHVKALTPSQVTSAPLTFSPK